MYFKQPKYYGEFKCLGMECKLNCCYGWRIDWKKDEVDKVINAPDCSPELKEIMETGFTPIEKSDENHYMVKLDEQRKCPCQTEEGLCLIQKELGAEYLSYVCTNYPRYNSFMDKNEGVVFRGCYMSCEEIVRKLISDEKSAELVSVPIKEEKIVKIGHRNIDEEFVSEKPEFEYRTQIVEFFYELIGDKKCSLETDLILGALAAEKLTELVEKKEYDRIPEALKSFRKQVHNAAALKSIDNIKPNFHASFGAAEKIINSIIDVNLTGLLKNKNKELDVERYITGRVLLDELMKDNPFWLRNIARSLILELCIPFKSTEHSIFENYSFFVATVAGIKLNAVAAAISPKKLNLNLFGINHHVDGMEDLISVFTGIISRRFFQNDKAFDEVIRILKEFGMNSPAYLALLIK